MGILARFKTIMESNVNALLDACEDPAKMVDQIIHDLEKQLQELTVETAGVDANYKRAKRVVSDCEEQILKATRAAENLLREGSEGCEDKAREVIERKQKLEEDLKGYKATAESAKIDSDRMKAVHKKLVQDLEDARSRRDGIKSTVATAKAQERVNTITSKLNSDKNMGAFDRMEAKANKMLDSANAMAELNEGTQSADDLIKQYADKGGSSVDDELAAMKERLGM